MGHGSIWAGRTAADTPAKRPENGRAEAAGPPSGRRRGARSAGVEAGKAGGKGRTRVLRPIEHRPVHRVEHRPDRRIPLVPAHPRHA